MNICLATEKDIPELCCLLGCLFEQEAEFNPDVVTQQKGLKKIIESPQIGEIIVSRKSDRIVGMVSLLYSISSALGGRVCMLEDMVVVPQFRGSDIGTKLIEHAVAYASEQGVMRMTLLTDQGNKAAHRFYQRQKFSISSMVVMRRFIPEFS